MFDRLIAKIRGARRAAFFFTLLAVMAIPAWALAAEGAAKEAGLMSWLMKFAPIAILVGVVAFVLARLPKIELGHSDAFLRRRVLNWLPLGLTYAFFSAPLVPAWPT